MYKVNRNWNFDLYRCIAVLFLVLLHLLNISSYQDNFILLYLFMLARPVITMFVLISGYFLFQQKEFTKSNIIKRILKIVIPLLYYYTIYYIWMHLTGKKTYPYLDVLKYPTGSGHLWYFYSILSVSIVSSFISLPILDSKKKALLYSGLTISLLLLLISIKLPPFNIDHTFYTNDFLLLAFVGYGLGNKYISLNSKRSIFITFCLWQLSVFATIFSKNQNPFNIFALSSIICLFLLIKAIPEQKVPILVKKNVSFIAKYSLSIYGWHILFNDNHLVTIIKQYVHSSYFSLPISYFSILGLSLACGIITSKIFSILFKREIII